MNNVLIRKNDLLKNSTLHHTVSNSETDSQRTLNFLVLLIIVFIIVTYFLNREKHQDKEDHQENHNEKDIDRYSMDIQWSDEDKAFIVTVPELPGCMTHGSTYEEAVQQGKDAIESWIDASRKWGDPIPPPRVATFA